MIYIILYTIIVCMLLFYKDKVCMLLFYKDKFNTDKNKGGAELISEAIYNKLRKDGLNHDEIIRYLYGDKGYSDYVKKSIFGNKFWR